MEAAGTLARINEARCELTLARLGITGQNASPLIFGAATAAAELAVRQYAIARFGQVTLAEAILESESTAQGRIRHPMPPEWRRELEALGFRVDRIATTMAWYAETMKLLAIGVLSIASQIGASIRSIGVRVDEPRTAHFVGLARGNLPQPAADGRSHDIVSWYRRWRGLTDAHTLSHDVMGAGPLQQAGIRIVARPAVPPIARVGEMLRFVFWAVPAAGVALVDVIRGRWWHAMMLREATVAAVARIHVQGALAGEYLFHNSAWIYRPLWTYEAERKGSRILFYFYSTNTEGFKRPTGYPPTYYGWQAANWPHYLVWNQQQSDFVRRAAAPAKVSVVGSIWFTASSAMVPSPERSAVAVFDVTPVRPSFYQRLGIDFDYYLPETVISFLEDVHALASENGQLMYWKRKRRIGPMMHRRYRRYSDALAARPDVRVVDPDLAAVRLIEAATMVVSMPFTSTALLAREMGKPSCYYDPTGRLDPTDRAAHGIPLLNTLDALRAWFRANAPSQADPSVTASAGHR